MMYCFGVNFQSADIALREALALSGEQRQQWLKDLRSAGVHEAIVLVTCNRTEIYAAGEDVSVAAAVDRVVEQHCAEHAESIRAVSYRLWERDVVQHVFRVVASLDSMVVGEPQIFGQAKAAFDEALALDMVGKTLHLMFPRAFHVGKKVRQETALAERPVSMSSVAVRLAAQVCGELDRARVLVVGAGEMGRATVRSLQAAGVRETLLINRTLERAQELAEEFSCTVVPWDRLETELAAVDIVVCNASCDDPLIDTSMMAAVQSERRSRSLFMIDIGLPRNVDAKVAQCDGVYLYNVDDLQAVAQQNMAARQQAIESADHIVQQATTQFWTQHQASDSQHTIASLFRKCEQIRQDEVRKTAQRIAQDPEHAEDALDACTKAIVTKILHDPILQVKPKAQPGEGCGTGEHVAGTWLRRLFRLDG